MKFDLFVADNTKKDSDSTPVKGGTDLGELVKIFVEHFSKLFRTNKTL